MSVAPPIPEPLWRSIPPDAQAAVADVVERYELQLADLRQQVADLQARLNQNSTNSSRPPSSDGPTVKRAPPQSSSGKKRGAQPDHPQQTRPLLPADDVIPCLPEHCRRCGHALSGTDPEPLRHQVIELPPIQPIVTEYQQHRLLCPHCGITTAGTLPDDAPQGGQGFRLQALVAMLSGAYRLSKRQISTLCDELLNIPLCPGQVCAVEGEVATALEPVVAELRDYVTEQPVHIDDSGWRQGGKRCYLWVAVTLWVTLFRIDMRRSGQVVRTLVGPTYAHVVTSDRHSSFNFLEVERRQACWAHLRRDFQAMIDRGGAGAGIGEELLWLSDLLFHCWHQVRDGPETRKWLQQQVSGWLRDDVRSVLERGRVCGCAKTQETCANLLRIEGALWTFVWQKDVEPTNNAAERALRHAVQWRKSSYGTASAAGSQFVANILSVVATCRQQKRNVLEVLTECCQAAMTGAPRPSLLPTRA